MDAEILQGPIKAYNMAEMHVNELYLYDQEFGTRNKVEVLF